MHRLVVGLVLLGACHTIFPKPEGPPPPKKPETRAEFDEHLRGELAKQPEDACARQKWIADYALTAKGLEAEVAEELKAEQVFACRQQKGGGKLADKTTPVAAEPEPLVFEAECTRQIAETKLRERGDKKIDKPAVEEAFAQCFNARVKACQTALDADIAEGIVCWRKHPWPEAPASIDAKDLGATAICLGELSAVVTDLKSCQTKKQAADRDACMAPYVGYVPKCAVLDAAKAWQTFPGHEDLERLANADAKRRADREAKIAKEKAEREARIAKEVARCNGATTLDIATRVSKEGSLPKVPGCRYQLAGNVLGKNNVYVQLADASGKIVFLVKTRDDLANATLGERTALFDAVESAELADGSTQKFAVFVLERR
jgi:hypothetical protein